MANLVRVVRMLLTLPRKRVNTATSLLTGWWLIRLLWRLRVLVAATLVVVFAYSAWGWVGIVLLAVVPPLASLTWRAVHPQSHGWFVNRLLARHRLRHVYGSRWDAVMVACNLHRSLPGGDHLTPMLQRVSLAPVGDVLHVRLLDGQAPADFTGQADELAHAFGVPDVRVVSAGPGRVELVLVERDVLAEPVILDDVPAVTDLRRVRFAIGEDGRWRTRDYANIAAEVGGGVPGSGKTAGETSLACGLIQNPAVQYVVIDGKGGEDWSWIAPRAAAYCAEDEDLEAVLTVVEQVHGLMRHRLKTQKATRGEANFWNLPLEPAHPVVFVVVDEVQTFTDAKGMDNETKQLAFQITARLSALVKKGRSAGIITRLLTQKPTSDALPTAIRDNASVRTAWRVVTDDAAEAILGPVVRRSDITPVDIGEEMRGVAVVANAAGRLERVRFPYVDEHTAETIATRVADLRRELTEFGAPTTDNDEKAGGSKDSADDEAAGVRA
jgi:DNA segregation ATPase FtsK/SpoIIIE, S-DNA-T family